MNANETIKIQTASTFSSTVEVETAKVPADWSDDQILAYIERNFGSSAIAWKFANEDEFAQIY